MIEGPGGEAMVIHQRAVDDEIGTQPSAYASGPACAGIVETTVSTMKAGEMVMRSGRALASAVVAVDMAVSPDGRQIAVVSAGNAGTDRQVQFFDAVDVSQPPSTVSPTDSGGVSNPCVAGGTVPSTGGGMDLPADPKGGMMPPQPVEYLPPNGEVVAVAFDRVGNVIVQSRQPATVQILTQRSAPIVLSSDVRADIGHQMFHTATAGKVACASCHPEGSEDGRVWRFLGEGQRRTQSLRGGIMDTAPFHWGGTLPTLTHLMRDVFQGRMAGPAVLSTDVDALSRWVDRIRSVPTSTWHDSAAVTRGQALFQDTTAACGSCHGGPDFTNSKSVDVGTGGNFQVPQLHNLAFRAPYMHDGCAATLADRFSPTCGGGDKHGVTSQLSRAQIDDLVAYLETL
jgi:mono/diheme cytochrome c family protein